MVFGFRSFSGMNEIYVRVKMKHVLVLLILVVVQSCKWPNFRKSSTVSVNA